MELIEIQLSEFTSRSRSLALSHSETGLRRGLEHGERVLIRSDRSYRTAVVADIEFSAEETHYRLVLGGHVPSEVAHDRLIGEINLSQATRPEPARKVTVEDIAVLLSHSSAGKRIPMQRQVARRLLDR